MSWPYKELVLRSASCWGSAWWDPCTGYGLHGVLVNSTHSNTSTWMLLLLFLRWQCCFKAYSSYWRSISLLHLHAFFHCWLTHFGDLITNCFIGWFVIAFAFTSAVTTGMIASIIQIFPQPTCLSGIPLLSCDGHIAKLITCHSHSHSFCWSGNHSNEELVLALLPYHQRHSVNAVIWAAFKAQLFQVGNKIHVWACLH